MSVYFIRAGRFFKIGASDDPQRRCDRLHRSGTRYTFPPEVAWDAPRELYRVVDGWKETEQAIHRALAQFDVGLEWFLDEPEVRAFIDSLPDDVEPIRSTLTEVERTGGWCGAEYSAVQAERAAREVARFRSRQLAKASA